MKVMYNIATCIPISSGKFQQWILYQSNNSIKKAYFNILYNILKKILWLLDEPFLNDRDINSRNSRMHYDA